MTALVDTHVHLARKEFDDDREEVRERAVRSGVGAFLHVGFDAVSNEHAQTLAENDVAGWATAGIHPHDATSYDDTVEQRLTDWAHDGRIVAIGECGLDFFRDLSPREVQREVFARQISLADRLGLPMVFHVRDAYDEARELLLSTGLPSQRGVFHAFAGDAAFARWAVDEGFKLGIGGPLTYKNSKLPAAIEGLGPESFLLETDAPWLPPQPWRGKRNEPAYLRVTAEFLAERLHISLDALAEVVGGSFEATFSVRLPEGVRSVAPSQREVPSRDGSV